ncbi:MAG: cation diffusion facilitator family transporter [Clostridiales bacterium]|nr:cation diffusion facilitator family transporter [Clostridiales bacterium]
MEKRTKNAVVTLAVGLALNILLGVTKLVAGILSRSASVASDALNNISDAAVSIVTIIATALAARRADHDHPFGHGRYEYIATFVVGAGILAVGVEAFISGIERIIEPVTMNIGVIVWVTLVGSIAVKGFMAVLYFTRAKMSVAGGDTLKAAAVDSVSDAAVTAVVLCCMIAELYTGAHIDGYASVAVAVVIVVFAVKILKTTISRLLGERPDSELYDTVRNIILSFDNVVSVHDLIINDYGAATKIAEADAEFPSSMSFVEVHSVCDGIEREVYDQTGIRLCIHADPIIDSDERLMVLRKRVSEILGAYGATAHDISINDDKSCVELDIHLPLDKSPEAEITAQVKASIVAYLPYDVCVNVDYI